MVHSSEARGGGAEGDTLRRRTRDEREPLHDRPAAAARGRPRGGIRSTWLVGLSVVSIAVLATLALASRCPPPPPRRPKPATSRADHSDAPALEGGGGGRALAQPEAAAVSRWRALREDGLLRGEVVTFLDCPGEAWRKVETDPQGRVVRYARHGVAGGVPFEAELFYGEDGALGAARYREASGAWRELRLAGANAGQEIPAPALDPGQASEAAAGAPPRCRF